MPKYKMQIDLSKCAGCGACAIACKLGNNTQQKASGQTFNWADFLTQTSGGFPYTKWQAVPVRCNHCDDPMCVEACPIEKDSNGRKAMYKDADTGLVLHDDSRCIGCRRCQRACPYSVVDVGAYKAQWSAISYGGADQHTYWGNVEAVVIDCTASPAEMMDPLINNAASDGKGCPPYRNKWTTAAGTAQHKVYDIRPKGIVEKCYFCIHRLEAGKLPYCVQACPASSRQVVVDEATTLTDDFGLTYNSDGTGTANDSNGQTKVATSLAVGAKVLAHGSLKRPIMVPGPLTVGMSRPNTYYIGSFSRR